MLRPEVLEESCKSSAGMKVAADGTIRLPAGCELLTKLYANHGVRIRMVRRQKIPTVRQLIDQLSRKHDQMLADELEARFRPRSRSSSTPTVPFSSSELLYGNDVTSRHQVGSDDVLAGELGTWGGDKQKLKELEVGNRRPTSRNSTSRKVPNFDKVAFDRDREELRPIANSLPPKQNPLRANGIKNNLLRADQYLNQRNNAPTSGRDEDLVAMGTLWSPSQLQARGSSTATSSSKSTSATNSASGGGQFASATLPGRRPINLSTTTSTRQLLNPSATATSTQPTGMGNFVRTTKEVEPKYSDPLVGAPPTFQQRLMELAALEAETVRWERTKKVKKKPKQDRDS